MTELMVAVIAGCFSIVSTLISSPVWAPGFWLRRKISDISSSLAVAPENSISYKSLLSSLDLCSARLTASLLVPLKPGCFVFAWFSSASAWVYGLLTGSDPLTMFGTISFFLIYTVGLFYALYVHRLRGRQAAAIRANRPSGFFSLRAGEFRARDVVSQRLVDGDLSLPATIRLIAERRRRKFSSPSRFSTATFQ